MRSPNGDLVTDPLPDQTALLDTFRETMRHVAATVFAVTTMHEGERYGILATSVSSLSFAPPSLLVCINQEASLHAPVKGAGRFCVNVLGSDNQPVAEHFSTAELPRRFDVGDWQEQHGLPVLADAQSSLICKIVDQHDFGTHSIFVGELVDGWYRGGTSPLTYCDRRYVEITERQVDGR